MAFDIKESNGYGYTIGGVLAVIIALVSYSSWPVDMVLVMALGTFLLFFLAGEFGALATAKKRFRKHSSLNVGEVHFAKEVIIFNGQLIMLSDYGQKLKYFSKEERFGMNQFTFIVQSGFGNKKNTNRFMIPIPTNREQEADKLFNYYSGLVV